MRHLTSVFTDIRFLHLFCWLFASARSIVYEIPNAKNKNECDTWWGFFGRRKLQWCARLSMFSVWILNMSGECERVRAYVSERLFNDGEKKYWVRHDFQHFNGSFMFVLKLNSHIMTFTIVRSLLPFTSIATFFCSTFLSNSLFHSLPMSWFELVLIESTIECVNGCLLLLI